jgi:hypothetical protein
VAWLGSPRNTYLNGAVVVLDGGTVGMNAATPRAVRSPAPRSCVLAAFALVLIAHRRDHRQAAADVRAAAVAGAAAAARVLRRLRGRRRSAVARARRGRTGARRRGAPRCCGSRATSPRSTASRCCTRRWPS